MSVFISFFFPNGKRIDLCQYIIMLLGSDISQFYHHCHLKQKKRKKGKKKKETLRKTFISESDQCIFPQPVQLQSLPDTKAI